MKKMTKYYFFSKQRSESDKPILNFVHGNDICFINEISPSLIEKMNIGDLIFFDSIEELLAYPYKETYSDDEINTIVERYIDLYKHGVTIQFDHSVQCNSNFIKAVIKDNEISFETILIECIYNYLHQKEITIKLAKKRSVTAKINGNSLGIKKGTKLVTKKSLQTKNKIEELSKTFKGNMADEELIVFLGISRNTYYKYKRELINDCKIK